MLMQNDKNHSLRKILYPMMVLALILPLGTSALPMTHANASRRPRITRQARRDHRRGKMVDLIYASYVRNKNNNHNNHGMLGRYIIEHAMMRDGALRGQNHNAVVKGWGNNKRNRQLLQRKVNRRNRSLRHDKSAPRNASYLVPQNQDLANGSQSTRVGENRHDHKGIVPIKIKSQTTLWDIARANLKHYNARTAKSNVMRSAKALKRLNPKVHNVYQRLHKGTVLMVPTNQARHLKTSFSVWAEFSAGLSKAARRDKAKIALVESTDNYHIWAGHRPGRNRPYGKYQLDTGYLHKEHGHKWDSPYAQEELANAYVNHKYGGWVNAYHFHRKHGYY